MSTAPASSGDRNKYGTPVVQTTTSTGAVVVNQESPVTVVTVLDPSLFKTSTVITQCPYCRNVVSTDVQTSCNCCAFCCCCWTGFVFYACVQCCRGKDICCCNAIHTCPSCKKQLGSYVAC